MFLFIQWESDIDKKKRWLEIFYELYEFYIVKYKVILNCWTLYPEQGSKSFFYGQFSRRQVLPQLIFQYVTHTKERERIVSYVVITKWDTHHTIVTKQCRSPLFWNHDDKYSLKTLDYDLCHKHVKSVFSNTANKRSKS